MYVFFRAFPNTFTNWFLCIPQEFPAPFRLKQNGLPVSSPLPKHLSPAGLSTQAARCPQQKAKSRLCTLHTGTLLLIRLCLCLPIENNSVCLLFYIIPEIQYFFPYQLILFANLYKLLNLNFSIFVWSSISLARHLTAPCTKRYKQYLAGQFAKDPRQQLTIFYLLNWVYLKNIAAPLKFLPTKWQYSLPKGQAFLASRLHRLWKPCIYNLFSAAKLVTILHEKYKIVFIL